MLEISVKVKMSCDKRQHARTQGKYQYDTESNGKQKRLVPGNGKQANKGDAVEKKEVLWCEDSNNHHFPQLDVTPQAKVINEPGHHVLSATENGESRIYFDPHFMREDKASMHFRKLLKSVEWCKKKIVIHGQEYRQPRLVAWFGPLPYEYSGITLNPKEFPDAILEIKRDVEFALKKQNIHVELNSVLLNLYRNCKDSVAWHSDDESSMGIHPTIASVSLGETRRFEMRRRNGEQRPDSKAEPELVVFLNSGSLIVMDGVMQQDWLHRVPKEYHDRDARINLTFRTVFPIESVPRPLSSRGEDYYSDKAIKEEPQSTQETFQYDDEQFPSLGTPGFSQPKPQRNWSDYPEHHELPNYDSTAHNTRRKSLETAMHHQNSDCDVKALYRQNSDPVNSVRNDNVDPNDLQIHHRKDVPYAFVPPFVPKKEDIANHTPDCASDLQAFNVGGGKYLSSSQGNAYNGGWDVQIPPPYNKHWEVGIPPPVPKREIGADEMDRQSDSVSNLQNNVYDGVGDDTMDSATDDQTEHMESEDCDPNLVVSNLNANVPEFIPRHVPEFIPRQQQAGPYSSHAYKNRADHKSNKTYTEHRNSGHSSAQHKTPNQMKNRSYNQNVQQNHNNGEYNQHHKSGRNSSDRTPNHNPNIQNVDNDRGLDTKLNEQGNIEQNSRYNPLIQNSPNNAGHPKHRERNFEQNYDYNPKSHSSSKNIGNPRHREKNFEPNMDYPEHHEKNFRQNSNYSRKSQSSPNNIRNPKHREKNFESNMDYSEHHEKNFRQNSNYSRKSQSSPKNIGNPKHHEKNFEPNMNYPEHHEKNFSQNSNHSRKPQSSLKNIGNPKHCEKNFESNMDYAEHHEKNIEPNMDYPEHHEKNFEQNSSHDPENKNSHSNIQGYPRSLGGGNQTNVSHVPNQNVKTQVYRNSNRYSNSHQLQQNSFPSENGKHCPEEQNLCPPSKSSSDVVSPEENSEYAVEGKKLADIYGYVKESWKDIHFSSRDREELKTLIAIIEESGPLNVNVMKIISRRMASVVELAENKELRPWRGPPNYSKRDIPPRHRKEHNFKDNYR